ncbi:MAG: tetratricopeptide repeat protein [FCB group bacterium]|nr:tetratricopeptide repeat protein [FCB group bacterium]
MAHIKCPACHAQVPANAKFCPECGVPLKANAKKTKKNNNHPTFLRDGIIILLVLIIVIGGFFMLKKPQVPSDTSHNNANQSDVSGMNNNMQEKLANLPADFNSLVQMGNQNMDQKHYSIAAECYKRALAIQPNSPDVRTDYGACLHAMGLPMRAIEEFRRVIKKYPKHGIANFNMGIVFYTQNKNDSARFYWHKFLTIDSVSEAAQTAKKLLKEIEG